MPANIESFLPEDYLEKRLQRRTNIVSLTLFVLVMGGIVGAFYVTDQQRAELVALGNKVDAQFVEAARRLEQLDELQRRKEQMIRKARITSTLLERIPRSILLAELINNMPPTLSMLEMQLESKPQKETRATQARTALDKAKSAANADPDADLKPMDVSVRVIGVAPTDVQVAHFMTALGKTDLFTDVNLAFSEEVSIDKETMRKFRVEMKLSNAVDARTYEPKLVKRELNQNPMGPRVTITPDAVAAPVSDRARQ